MTDMGGMEGMKDKLKDEDLTDKGLEKGGDFVDDKTGDKHAEHVDKAQEFGDEKLGR